MSAMQVYFWKVCQSSGLARQYAHNQLDLYMLALSHFRKTYWTADLQYNMFIEALKSLDGKTSAIAKGGTEAVFRHQEERSTTSAQPTDGLSDAQYDGSHMPTSLEDFLISFNPFMGVPMQGDDLGYARSIHTFPDPADLNDSSSIDWGLSPASPLRIGESPAAMPAINP